MTPADFEQQAEQLADLLQARGYLVTRDRAVEPDGVASLLGITTKTLRNWRSEMLGPPSRAHGRMVLYPLVEFVRWRGEQQATAGR